MNKTFISSTLYFTCILLAFTFLTPVSINAHCQIPCGIYNDYARVSSMLEDVKTLTKSIKLINVLSGQLEAQSRNQLTRWVINKEKHAQNIIDTICNYFLTQRVKPDTNDYSRRLISHHAVIIAAMKVKQNTDQRYVDALKKAVEKLLTYYKDNRH